MKYNKISIILTGISSFEVVVNAVQRSLGCDLLVRNEEGRKIAYGKWRRGKVEVVDKYDELSPTLCDENHVIEFSLPVERAVAVSFFEEKILCYFVDSDLDWNKAVLLTDNRMVTVTYLKRR